jgi:hypothetical protein
MDGNSDDAAIEQFHAEARRRRRRIMAVTAALCGLIGAAILVVAFTVHDAGPGMPRYEIRTILVGVGFIAAAGASVVMALKGD